VFIALTDPVRCVDGWFSNGPGSIAWLETNCAENFKLGSSNKDQWISAFKHFLAGTPEQAASPALIAFCISACPDANFELTEPLSLQEDGKVTGLYKFGGTHTGIPFSPREGLPPIEASGTVLKNDPQRATFTFENGKIVDLLIENPEGTVLHGGKGWYKQLGGEIPAPTPAPADA
jgi:hypothetical protein